MPKKVTKRITRSVSADLARTRFGRILDRVAENRERFVVTKNGQAKAVILGVNDFLHAVVKTPASLAALQQEAQKSGMSTLSWEEIEAEIELARQEKAQRKI